jgi:hypothetical protein
MAPSITDLDLCNVSHLFFSFHSFPFDYIRNEPFIPRLSTGSLLIRFQCNIGLTNARIRLFRVHVDLVHFTLIFPLVLGKGATL